MVNYFFTSDTHFGHANVLKYDNRPFNSIEEHDRELEVRWNKTVGKNDVVFHIGDFSWYNHKSDNEALLARLNGRKYLIAGNHDHKRTRSCEGWEVVTHYHEVTIENVRIVLSHYRMVVWNRSHFGSWMLHGHSHGTLPINYDAMTLDVGCMIWDYAPVSFGKLQLEMKKHRWTPVDAHGVNVINR